MIRSLRRAYHFTHRLLLAGVFAAVAAGLWSVRDAASGLAPPADLPDHDYLPDITALADAGDVAGALCLCDGVAAIPDAPNAAKIAEAATALREKHRGAFASARRFTAGFFTGSLESGEEVLFHSPDDLIRKTPSFFVGAARRLEHDLGGAHGYAGAHFGGENLYWDAVERNIRFAKQLGDAPEVVLRRRPPATPG